MANPYTNPGNRSTSMATGTPGLMPRRSSYAAVVSGTAPTISPAFQAPTRAGAFSHLLNDSHDFGGDMYNPGRGGAGGRRSTMEDPRQHGNAAGASWGSWGVNGQLPHYSRAYAELTNTYGYDGHGGEGPFEHFFVPSYLRGSRYVQSLETAYRAKIAASREAQSRHSSQPGSLSTSSSTANLSGKLAPSHRGMTYDLIEKAAPADQEGPQPLPSKWNVHDKYGGLEVLRDGYEVAFTGNKPSSEREHEAYSIRADHPMPAQSGIYYFEVKIISRKREDSIGIGFSTKDVPLHRPPGWEPNSWAYHGDDGHSFCCQSSGKNYGPTYTTDDVIGCGVNFHTGSAFFTKNGNHLGTAFREVRGRLYPSVGMKRPGEHVWVNFGQSPFVFDIDGMILSRFVTTRMLRDQIAKMRYQNEKREIEAKVEATSTAKLAPPLDETSLIQALVLQYLSHDGYVESAKAFSGEVRAEKQALSIGTSKKVKGFEFVDDNDASQRQEIRNAVLDGDVDKALQLTSTHYPTVLQNDEDIYFRLQCRKFIEMIRRGAEMRASTSAANHSNGHHEGGWYDDMVNLDMEIDQPSESGGFDKMDTDGNGVTAHDDYEKLLEDTINFGKALQAEFSHDPRRSTQRALQDAFSLLAYEDPMDSPHVAYHLHPHKRLTLAEDLNSAILVSQGKPSSASLERLIKQIAVLTEDLSENGGPGSFVNVYDYMKPRIGMPTL